VKVDTKIVFQLLTAVLFDFKCTNEIGEVSIPAKVDFILVFYDELGNSDRKRQTKRKNIADIQHVRRRETIAMTPADSYCSANISERFSNSK
jgi:hypothetical protein